MKTADSRSFLSEFKIIVIFAWEIIKYIHHCLLMKTDDNSLDQEQTEQSAGSVLYPTFFCIIERQFKGS